VKSIPFESRRFEFGFPNLDTLLRVEVTQDGVTVRASRDTFTRRHKANFVRELAAEGFIPDEYRWFALEDGEGFRRGVHWVVDVSWMSISEEVIARGRRFMARLLACACMLLAFLLAMAITGHLGSAGGVHPVAQQNAVPGTILPRGPG
jgi:hypothetical protein